MRKNEVKPFLIRSDETAQKEKRHVKAKTNSLVSLVVSSSGLKGGLPPVDQNVA